MRKAVDRGPKKQTLGGRCANCGDIFINKPLYRFRGNDFVCKECLKKMQEEAEREPEGDEFEDTRGGSILTVNEEDL